MITFTLTITEVKDAEGIRMDIKGKAQLEGSTNEEKIHLAVISTALTAGMQEYAVVAGAASYKEKIQVMPLSAK